MFFRRIGDARQVEEGWLQGSGISGQFAQSEQSIVTAVDRPRGKDSGLLEVFDQERNLTCVRAKRHSRLTWFILKTSRQSQPWTSLARVADGFKVLPTEGPG